MAYTFIRNGFGARDTTPTLTKLDEQPIDNESKENIYLSSRLVEKQRLEDAKLIDKYDKACRETKEYKALQDARKQIDKRYEEKIGDIKSQLIMNKDGESYIGSIIKQRDYYQKVSDAFDQVGGDDVNRSFARGKVKELNDRLECSMSNREQVALYNKLQKLEARKATELEPWEHQFETTANRRKRGAVKEALRRAEILDLSDKIEQANRACAVNDMYLQSFEESQYDVNDETRYLLNQNYQHIVSNDFDAVLAKAERTKLMDEWEKIENEVWEDSNKEGLSTKQQASLKESETLINNCYEKRVWRHKLIAENGCNPDEVDSFVNKVDGSVNEISRKIQDGTLPMSVLEARSYDPSSYDAKIEKVEPGTKVHNKLENSDYVTDENRCFVVTGTAGEQWPVNGDKLKSKYGLDPESIKDGESTTAHVNGGSDGIWAVPVTGNHKIETSWGDVLETNAAGVEHGDGDYIVSNSPDFSDTWVVNGAVFGNTYEESEDNTFVSKAFDKIATSSQSDDADDLVNGIVGSSANSKFETFKDKDGNKCRRNKATGETTVWVEGYDRVRCGKVEHVKSYWKVLHK